MGSDRITEKLYYRENLQSEFEARVIELRKREKLWEVVLDRTCFFPEGGGQPADRGWINGIPVRDVQKEGETIFHFLEENPGEKTVKGKINMEWRRDFMQQHTGQHIISAALWQVKGFETVSVHMGMDHTTIEIDAREISEEDIKKVEDLANQIIMMDLPIRFIQADSRDLGRYPMRKPTAIEGQVRLVEIENFDCVGCGGLHFESTRFVSLVKAAGIEKIRDHARIIWKIGQRAFEDYRKKHDVCSSLKPILEAEAGMFVERTASLKTELAVCRKRASLLEDQLAASIAQNLYEKKRESAGSGLCIITESWHNEDDQLIKKIMKNLMNRNQVVVCLVNCTAEKILWSIGCSEDINFPFEDIKEKLLKVIDGKGGGRFPLWQGTGSGPEKADVLLSKFKDILRSL